MQTKGMFLNFQKRKRGTWDYDKFFKLNLQTCQIAQIKKKVVNIFWIENGAPKNQRKVLHWTPHDSNLVRSYHHFLKKQYFVAPCGSSIEMELCPKTTIIANVMSLATFEAHNFFVWFPIGEFSKAKLKPLKKNSNSANNLIHTMACTFPHLWECA
jgi:hypothetical protein